MIRVTAGRPAAVATMRRRPALSSSGSASGVLPTGTSSTAISTSGAEVESATVATRPRSTAMSRPTSARRSAAICAPPSARYRSKARSAQA
ncbi:hypothetical protein SCE1572_02720 [Sorangium cellulosum So0157-2]|uniref:Uncharacterized protein n=1 Tax=Sorangium cellulosum So0157-2 TaxID=1254432 RepID=S4XK32_SORCE|nr:hypothetical protein SCE1572_02720 [Sorangium cellulosum So0157-2]